MLQEDQARRAQLRAGAEALVAWTHARRNTWSTEPREIAPKPVLSALDGISALPIVEEERPDVRPAVAAGAVPEPAPVPVPVSVEPAKPVVRFKIPSIPTEAIRAMAGPVLRWSLRAAVLAALVAGVAGGGWMARPYVMKLLIVPTTGTVVLESQPSGSEVLVDGASLGKAPLTTELSPGPHIVEFRQRNATRKIEVEVTAGEQTVARVDWSTTPTGRLLVRSDPDGARVLVDGRERGVTPLTLDDLTVGSHAVVVQTDQGSVRRTVAVTAERDALVTESIYPGWVKLFAPFEVQVSEGARALRVDEQSQVLLSPGTHELRLENRSLGYSETRRVEIEPGKTTSVSLVPSPSMLTVTATTPAIVLVDGEPAGETPLTEHPVSLGTRDIVVRSATGQERRFTRRVTMAPVRIDVDFLKR